MSVHFIPEKNVILVTDTYNHKIKVVDPFRNEAFSWLGSGQGALTDGSTFQSRFNEPNGISSLFDEKTNDVKIYVCDTNNHCIRRVFYDQGDVSTPVFIGVPMAVRQEETEAAQKEKME